MSSWSWSLCRHQLVEEVNCRRARREERAENVAPRRSPNGEAMLKALFDAYHEPISMTR
jgi:hypothetical protein